MRLFVGFPLPEDIRFQLEVCQPAPESPLRLVERANLHITLHFLGEADANVVHEALCSIQFNSFQVRIDRLGSFSGREGSKTLWAGVQESNELEQLHNIIGERLVEKGFKLEKRKYKPHVTLVRCKKNHDRKIVQSFINRAFIPMEFKAECFSLFHSDLKMGYPRYSRLYDYPLN